MTNSQYSTTYEHRKERKGGSDKVVEDRKHTLFKNYSIIAFTSKLSLIWNSWLILPFRCIIWTVLPSPYCLQTILYKKGPILHLCIKFLFPSAECFLFKSEGYKLNPVNTWCSKLQLWSMKSSHTFTWKSWDILKSSRQQIFTSSDLRTQVSFILCFQGFHHHCIMAWDF